MTTGKTITLPKGWTQEKYEGLVKVVGAESANGFVASEVAKERMALEKQAKTNASDACVKTDGRFYKEYHPLDVKCQAIYDKAVAEERKALGLPPIEAKNQKN